MARLLKRFIPAHINHPFRLLANMLTSGKRAAFFTLWLTALGIALTPVDLLLKAIERFRTPKTGHSSDDKAGPFIFVCGPARSGTTLVYQVLAQHLDVAYIRNFTTLFSRSPLLASALFTRHYQPKTALALENYYGKTAGLQGPSEANHLWHQWVDADPSGFRTQLPPDNAEAMATFFRQFSLTHQMPVVCKNNNLNAFADVVAEHLENSYFICLRRDTDFLAQSLLRARLEINADIEQSYGVVDVSKEPDDKHDPVAQVLRQIDYLNSLATRQQTRIGADRFWIIDYETFCQDPGDLLARINHHILKRPELINAIDSITHNNLEKDAALLLRIRKARKKPA